MNEHQLNMVPTNQNQEDPHTQELTTEKQVPQATDSMFFY